MENECDLSCSKLWSVLLLIFFKGRENYVHIQTLHFPKEFGNFFSWFKENLNDFEIAVLFGCFYFQSITIAILSKTLL